MRPLRAPTLLLALSLTVLLGASPPVSDAVKAPRPPGGEYLGLYLMSKKVGYLFTDFGPVPGHPDQVRNINELVFKAQVGSKTSERKHREERIYESKPGGRLLSFVIDQRGDGGTQRMDGTNTPQGLKVVRARPGVENQTLTLPPSQETVEDADQARVALFRQKKVEGFLTDAQDLGSYRVETTLEAPEERVLGGVKVKLGKVVTLSQKEKVPVEAFLTQSGALIEVRFGNTMQARAEPEAVAKRLDQVEVFGLTRIVLPKALPAESRAVPGSVSFVAEGLPPKFQRDTDRQKYKALPDGKVQVTLSAAVPRVKKPRPLADPEGGTNLKTSIVMESDSPEIRKLAQEIVGEEKDAYSAARKIVSWVATHLEKDYGASADRATDVLRQKKGDCTEHSLLAVSLLRAAGIPAKRIDGVVYLRNEDGVPAFYWHEWVAAFVGEWTQMDPTFHQMVADSTHFALGEEGNAEITPLIGQLKVVSVR